MAGFDSAMNLWVTSENVSAAAVDGLKKLGYTSLDELGVAYAGVPEGIKLWQGSDEQQLTKLRKEVPDLLPLPAMKLLKMLGKKRGLVAKSGSSVISKVMMLLSILVLVAGGIFGQLTTRTPAERQVVFDKVVNVLNTSIGLDITPYISHIYYHHGGAAGGVQGGASGGNAGDQGMGVVYPDSLEQVVETLTNARFPVTIDLGGKTVTGALEKAIKVRADGVTILNGKIAPSPSPKVIFEVSGDDFRMEGVTLEGESEGSYNSFSAEGMVSISSSRGSSISSCTFTGGDAAVSVQAAEVTISSCQLSGVSGSGKGSKISLSNSKISSNEGPGFTAAGGTFVEINDVEVSNVGGEGIAISGEDTVFEAHRISVFKAQGGAFYAGEGALAKVYDSQLMGGDEDCVMSVGGSHVVLERVTLDRKTVKSVGGTSEESDITFV